MPKRKALKAAKPPRGKPAQKVIVRTINARYDAAQTTDDNRKHWANADSLGPNAALSPKVRMDLRNRARYEVGNNSFAKGIGWTITNDTIGDGPTLQAQLSGRKNDNRAIEAAFWRWVQATNLVHKLRQMRFARYDSGEVFAWFVSNPELPGPVKLDVRLIEAEQISDSLLDEPLANGLVNRDGIIYDRFSNPRFYRRLRVHPGETEWLNLPTEFDDIPASEIFHYYRAERPEQCRGIPDITPAIMLFAELRRFTQATIAAAETAAEWALVVYTDSPPPETPTNGEPPEQPSAGDLVHLEKRAGVVMPHGWKGMQITPEHPATTYDTFVTAKLKEIARCLCVPAHVASLDPTMANMSSSYVVGQMYVHERKVDRAEINRFLDKCLQMWLAEARKVDFFLPQFDEIELPHEWFWPSLSQHADPQKVATARETRLATGASNLAIECAADGLDWEEVQEKDAETLGITVQELRKRLADKRFGPVAKEKTPNAEEPEDERTQAMHNGKNGHRIEAAAPKPSINMEASAVELHAEAAQDGKPAARSFKMTAYTGGAMQVAAYFHPVVVDLEGFEAGNSARPILIDHHKDINSVLGQTSEVGVKDGKIVAEGKIFGESEQAKQVIALNDRGFKFQASVGLSVLSREFVEAGQSVTVNGQKFNGPINVARKSLLGEISFVTLGADDNTSARIAATAAKGNAMDFAKWLEAKGFSLADLTDQQKAPLQAQYDAEQSASKKDEKKPDGPADTRLKDTITAAEKREQVKNQIVDLTANAIQEYPGKVEVIKALSEQAFKGEWETSRFELELLRAMRSQAPGIGRSHSDEGMTANVIEAAVCSAGGLGNIDKHFDARTLEAAHKKWSHGLGLIELLMLSARRNGYESISARNTGEMLRAAFTTGRVMIQGAAFSTFSLSGILSNVANKFIRDGFNAVESTWQGVAATRPVRDFKTITTYTLTGDFKYKKLPPGGEIEHAAADELEYTNKADTYARMFAITRQDLINDDLGALTIMQRRNGRGAALAFNEVFWTEFLAEHTSGKTLFPTDNSKLNYIAGATPGTNDSRMNIEGLTRATTQFAAKTDPDGHPLGVLPRVLLVPPALEIPALNLMNSVEVRDTTASTVGPTSNPFAGRFRVVSSSYLANSAMGGGYSTAAWYLLADPNDLPFIEVVFLNGVTTPTIETADADFNTLGIQMRGYHDFGVETQEYRAALKSKGAA